MQGYYGKPVGITKPKPDEINVPLILDLIEGYYLVQKSKIKVYKLNEIVRALNSNPTGAIELAHEAQKIERSIDDKYRDLTIRVLDEITVTKELLLLKDIVSGVEEMADKCLEVSDSFISLALSL